MPTSQPLISRDKRENESSTFHSSRGKIPHLLLCISATPRTSCFPMLHPGAVGKNAFRFFCTQAAAKHALSQSACKSNAVCTAMGTGAHPHSSEPMSPRVAAFQHLLRETSCNAARAELWETNTSARLSELCLSYSSSFNVNLFHCCSSFQPTVLKPCTFILLFQQRLQQPSQESPFPSGS